MNNYLFMFELEEDELSIYHYSTEAHDYKIIRTKVHKHHTENYGPAEPADVYSAFVFGEEQLVPICGSENVLNSYLAKRHVGVFGGDKEDVEKLENLIKNKKGHAEFMEYVNDLIDAYMIDHQLSSD
ncbi:hypothetical protein GGI18_000212 [Coemansia linderi]|uniref:Uncharacterized protein n=1 Tax=Coemansia linderi TaxID=2663919 RepID=A0ACC1KNV0_9FUNG|nr:hypothetical protein GGI18_000212 [Coemansia linderi]